MTPIYNIPLVLRFGESLDPVVLDRALRAVIERHEVLRTRFPSVDGQPRQEILAAGSYEPELAVAVPQSVEGDGLYPAVSEVAGVGFDLAAAPPLRARLFREADGSYVLVWVFHHVVGDGGSLTPLAGDLVQAYSALEQGAGVEWAPLEVQFADYALWHDRLLGDPADPDSLAGRQLGFWGGRWRGRRSCWRCRWIGRGRRGRVSGRWRIGLRWRRIWWRSWRGLRGRMRRRCL